MVILKRKERKKLAERTRKGAAIKKAKSPAQRQKDIQAAKELAKRGSRSDVGTPVTKTAKERAEERDPGIVAHEKFLKEKEASKTQGTTLTPGAATEVTGAPQPKKRGILDVAKAAAFGNILETDPFTGERAIDPDTGEPAQVALGQPPLIGFGGAGAAAGTAKAAVKVSEKSVTRISNMFNRNPNVVRGMMEKKLLQNTIADSVKTVSIKKLATVGGATLLGLGGTLATTDVMFQWYALDNVIGGEEFFIKEVRRGLSEGTLTAEQATEAVEESKVTREIAISKVRKSNSVNPLLFAFRKLILAGVEAYVRAIELVEE